MGFFSWVCPGCDHCIRHDNITWQSDCVAIPPPSHGGKAKRVAGVYNGYGKVVSLYDDVFSIDQYPPTGEDIVLYEVWHRACWRIKRSPEWKTGSQSDPYQGIPNYRTPEEPRNASDLRRLRARARDRSRGIYY
jgi:hypothetical protein